AQMDRVQRAFLEKALAFYQRFADEYRDDPAFQYDRGVAYRRVGDIHRRMGRHEQALTAYGKAAPILEQLVATPPGRAEYVRELARIVNNRGVVLKVTGRHPEAEADYRRAVQLRLGLDQDGDDQLRGLAESHLNLGLLLADTNHIPEAEKAYRQ